VLPGDRITAEGTDATASVEPDHAPAGRAIRPTSSGSSRWLRFALRRLIGLVVSIAILLVGSFMLIHLIPGDPVRTSVGINAPQSFVQQRREELHLNDPLYKQFLLYTRDAATLNFGTSITTGEPVSFIVKSRIAKTVELAVLAIVIVMVVGVTFGVTAGALTADGRRRYFEAGFESFSGAVIAVPEFLLATFLVYLFAVKFSVFPVAGADSWKSYVLPALAIAIAPAIAVSRIVRLETLKVLSQDYMLTARSKRLPRRIIYARHALPNLLTGALTIGGLLFAALLGGTVIVENVFAWPGLGTAAVNAILGRDYPTVQAIVLMLGVFVLVVNTIVDVVIALLDPRSIILEA
jgi:peptide/nickel transport system permease protein